MFTETLPLSAAPVYFLYAHLYMFTVFVGVDWLLLLTCNQSDGTEIAADFGQGDIRAKVAYFLMNIFSYWWDYHTK